MNSDVISFLESEGYFNLKEIPGRGICGLYRFMFTVGLVIGINQFFYEGRYCYSRLQDAKTALDEWDGINDPPGEWIKYKGEGGERSRINTEGD